MTVPRGNEVDRLVRSIWEKDSPEMLARVRPRLVREVRALEAQCAAATTDAAELASAAALAEARYYLALFDEVVKLRGLTLPGEGSTT
jgi:hypothetical protein